MTQSKGQWAKFGETVVSVDEVLAHVVYSELQLVLLEEGQDLFDAQAVIDVLVRLAQDLEDRPTRDPFLVLLLRWQQGVLAVVV